MCFFSTDSDMFQLESTRSKLNSKQQYQQSERSAPSTHLNLSQLPERLQPVHVGSLTMWSPWSQWNPRSSQVMQFIHRRYDGKQWTAMESIQQLPAPLPLASWESGSRWSTSCESSDESSKPWKGMQRLQGAAICIRDLKRKQE